MQDIRILAMLNAISQTQTHLSSMVLQLVHELPDPQVRIKLYDEFNLLTASHKEFGDLWSEELRRLETGTKHG